MRAGVSAAIAFATPSRSSTSTGCHRTSSDTAGGGVPGRCHARSRARPRRRSNKCPPANPVAPVTSVGPSDMRLGPCARPVLLLVVLAERGILVFDGPPPPLVVAIPRDRSGEAVVKLLPGRPAEPPQLGRIERVAPVVPGPIGDRADEGRRAPGQLEDAMGEVDVAHLVAAADVVDLAEAAAFDDEVDRAAVVVDMEPIANVQAVTVEGQGDAVDGV